MKQIRKRSNSPEHLKTDLPPEFVDLATKTGIDYKQLNLLRNPLLPHGLQESKKLLEIHNQHSQVSVFTACENLTTLPLHLYNEHNKLSLKDTSLMDKQISAKNEANSKLLKALQYQVKMVVSSGSIHQLLTRTGIHNKDYYNEAEVLEGTFNYFKIEMKGLQQPLKIFIRYVAVQENALFGDLHVFMSSKIDKPDVNTCEKAFVKPLQINIEQTDPVFQYEYLYFKMVSTYGCKMMIKLVFPKEDVRDR